MLVADIVYAMQTFGNGYTGGAVDAAWLISYAFLGGALLYPDADEYLYAETDRLDEDVLRPATPGRTAVRERTVLERSTQAVTQTLAQDLRFGMIVVWTGRMLLGLAMCAVLLGTRWMAGTSCSSLAHTGSAAA